MSESAGDFNVYICKACGHPTPTTLRDTGTTPAMIGCTADGCDADAWSVFYRVTIAARTLYELRGIDWLWILPTADEFAAWWRWKEPTLPDDLDADFLDGAREGTQQHVDQGGLILVPAKADWLERQPA